MINQTNIRVIIRTNIADDTRWVLELVKSLVKVKSLDQELKV